MNRPAATAAADTPRKTEMPVLPPVVREFTAGVHYLELPSPVPTSTGADGIEVCEFFMFPCPHCFNLEPLLEDWAARQSDDVTLVRVPVLWNDSARLQARAFYAAEALGRLDELIEPMFAAIHVDGNRLDSADKIRLLFVEHGVSAEEFDSAFSSRRVDAGIRRAEELNRRYAIDSTPTVAVNGKYVTGPSLAGSYEAMFDVVDALVESERANPALLSPRDTQSTSIDELIDLIRNGPER